MSKRFLVESLGWGFILWFIGFGLGMILFPIVPTGMIGWIITPIGILITLWVLFKKIKAKQLIYYFKLAVTWTFIAVIFDYLFIVKAFNPPDGYYKFDVYLYYILTFLLPLIAGYLKKGK